MKINLKKIKINKQLFSLRNCLICHECGKRFKNKKNLKIHIRRLHKNVAYCKDYRTKNLNTPVIDEYQSFHLSEKISSSDFRKYKNETYTANCPVCKVQFSNENHLIRHLLFHVSEDSNNFNGSTNSAVANLQLYCDSCNANYLSKRELVKHMKSKHENLFTNRRTINRLGKGIRRKKTQFDYEEILTDDGKKEIVGDNSKKIKEVSECPYCKTKFSMKKNLLKHMRIIHCVTDHEVSAFDDRKPKIGHKCSECEKIFSLRKNLYQHLRKIHGRNDVGRKASTLIDVVRLICDACGVGFSEKKSLTRHLRIKHAVKIGREKKTVAVCVHCNSTFAHRKSLYKHERKFHGAQYKKIIGENSNANLAKKLKEKSEKPGNIDDYDCLKEILPERSDYKLTQFAWLEHDNYSEVIGNWFKAKLYFYCDGKDDVKKWKENYEMMNKLCLRVLSFPRPRTPGVLYKGRFRCHHNTMPKKGAKPNAKHTACSAVLSITLIQGGEQQSQRVGEVENRMKAAVFLKNTHNHAVGDPASLKYRKPIREVKEKFLKLFEEKKTVPQVLAIHRADLEKEYGPESFQSIINDRAFMPDARWAYGLYYSCFKKKREETDRLNVVSPETVTAHTSLNCEPFALSSFPPPPTSQDPHKVTIDTFKSICSEIIDRCESSPTYFYSGLQTFVSVYAGNCNTDTELLAALQSFGKCNSANYKTRPFQSKNVVSLQNAELAYEDSAITSTPVLHPFIKYNTVSVNAKPRITQTRNSVVQSTVLANERDMLASTPVNSSLVVHNSSNSVETRTLFTLEASKYDDCILYPIENRQNVTANCWVPAEYSMF